MDFASAPGILLMLVTFALTFLVARTLRKWFFAKRAKKQQETARANESRQVRRARERRETGR